MGRRKDALVGSCYSLNCAKCNKVFFAKQMKHGITSFYYLPDLEITSTPNLGSESPIYTNYVHVDVFREWNFIGIQELTIAESERVVVLFRQDFTNLNDCALIIPGTLEEKPCAPEDCIGLERSVSYDSTESVCEKLVSIVTGVKQRAYELLRLRIPGIDKPFDFGSKLPLV
jgi:hypothetical protein